VQSFRSLLEALSTQSRNVCRMTGDDEKAPTATMLTMPTVLINFAHHLPAYLGALARMPLCAIILSEN
jgi:hypothetical protein